MATGIALPPSGIDRLPEQSVGPALAARIAGKPANGSVLLAQPTNAPLQNVIWVDAGDEVLVHLDSVRARVLNGSILISIDLETDQTGRTPLVVVFATGALNDPAGLVAVTDELPRGNAALAGRWGPIVRDAVWSALQGIAADFAAIHKFAPRGISATQGVLVFQAGAPLTVVGGVLA